MVENIILSIVQALTEVLNKSHYGNSHLQIRQNPVTIAKHSGHCLQFEYHLNNCYNFLWAKVRDFIAAKEHWPTFRVIDSVYQKLHTGKLFKILQHHFARDLAQRQLNHLFWSILLGGQIELDLIMKFKYRMLVPKIKRVWNQNLTNDKESTIFELLSWNLVKTTSYRGGPFRKNSLW